MGSLSKIFQAEVMAILMRTALFLFKNVQKRIYICSDNKAAIGTLAKSPPNQLWERMQTLENLSRSNEVTLVWLCGYHAILTNEADKLAEKGTNGVNFDKSVGIPSVVGTVVIRNYLTFWRRRFFLNFSTPCI